MDIIICTGRYLNVLSFFWPAYSAFRPSGDISCDNRMEHALPHTGVFLVKRTEQFLGILALCVAVHRAFAFYYGESIFILKADYVHLINKHERADHCKVHAV